MGTKTGIIETKFDIFETKIDIYEATICFKNMPSIDTESATRLLSYTPLQIFKNNDLPPRMSP